MATRWGMTPRESVAKSCKERGEEDVVAQCVAILSAKDYDESILFVLAGPHADLVLRGGEGGPDGYWPMVWALRGLLYAWEPSASGVVVAAATDDSWRVREMSAKVVAKRCLDEAVESMASLANDAVPRVRAAAERALARIVGNDVS